MKRRPKSKGESGTLSGSPGLQAAPTVDSFCPHFPRVPPFSQRCESHHNTLGAESSRQGSPGPASLRKWAWAAALPSLVPGRKEQRALAKFIEVS